MTYSVEDVAAKISSNVECVFVAAGTCLPSRCLATIEGGVTQTHTYQGHLISLVLFFQNKESLLKILHDR
jgi:hypothetical protein